ncbi:hypothetical protein ACFLTJ_03185 [Chloroflexota bacterium]
MPVPRRHGAPNGACRELEECRYTQFDPRVVSAFFRVTGLEAARDNIIRNDMSVLVTGNA